MRGARQTKEATKNRFPRLSCHGTASDREMAIIPAHGHRFPEICDQQDQDSPDSLSSIERNYTGNLRLMPSFARIGDSTPNSPPMGAHKGDQSEIVQSMAHLQREQQEMRFLAETKLLSPRSIS